MFFRVKKLLKSALKIYMEVKYTRDHSEIMLTQKLSLWSCHKYPNLAQTINYNNCILCTVHCYST